LNRHDRYRPKNPQTSIDMPNFRLALFEAADGDGEIRIALRRSL
jgi:hypothetical protein